MKYLKQVYDRLIRGNFISRDSLSETQRQAYRDIDECNGEYADFFESIGFTLEEGDGYYYLARAESRTELTKKLERYGHWIDVLDFLKAWEPIFSPGYRFRLSRLQHAIDIDIELKEKVWTLYENKERPSEIASRLIDELNRSGFIETIDETTEEYQVTNAFLYLEEIVEMLTFEETEETEDETAQ